MGTAEREGHTVATMYLLVLAASMYLLVLAASMYVPVGKRVSVRRDGRLCVEMRINGDTSGGEH